MAKNKKIKKVNQLSPIKLSKREILLEGGRNEQVLLGRNK